MSSSKNRSNPKHRGAAITAVDLFCGVGGLTRGLVDAGIRVAAGYDIDTDCAYGYSHNNVGTKFVATSVTELTGKALRRHYPKGHIRVLVGCAPCQPFSKYTQGVDTQSDEKWGLLYEFARLIREVKPEVISMENVPELQRHAVFSDFLTMLRKEGFHFSSNAEKRVVYGPDYGIPQQRRRLVLLASKLGPIELIPPTHKPQEYRCVRDVLSELPSLKAGEVCPTDPLHRSSSLSPLNLRRIRHSKPGSTWRDWPDDLVADCHREVSGGTYPSVYGRMEWDKPSPTITTQFYGFGNGRFGHPKQNRGLSLREGAILQSFPRDYEFVRPDGEYHFKTIGRMIGNAVPVRLGEVVGKTIKKHLGQHGK